MTVAEWGRIQRNGRGTQQWAYSISNHLKSCLSRGREAAAQPRIKTALKIFGEFSDILGERIRPGIICEFFVPAAQGGKASISADDVIFGILNQARQDLTPESLRRYMRRWIKRGTGKSTPIATSKNKSAVKSDPHPGNAQMSTLPVRAGLESTESFLDKVIKARSSASSFEEVAGILEEPVKKVLKEFHKAYPGVFIPPQRKSYINYLLHPRVSAAAVKKLREISKLTFKQIGIKIGVSTNIARKVHLAVVASEPQENRPPPVKYVTSPKVLSAVQLSRRRAQYDKIMQLRRQGHSYKQVAKKIKVPYDAVLKTVHLEGPAERIARLRPKLDYTRHPRVKVSDVNNLMQYHLTFGKIGEILKASGSLVRHVYNASHKGGMRKKTGRGPYRDYLKIPGCSFAKVVRMREKGKTFAEIGKAFKVSAWIAKQVYFTARPKSPRLHQKREKTVDYLKHPRTPLADVLRMKSEGKTLKEIAGALGTSTSPVVLVLRAAISAGVAPPKIDGKRSR